MGRKVNPKSLRLKINQTWDASWFAGKKQYAQNVFEDANLRKELTKQFKEAGLARLDISRESGKIIVTIFTSKPGLVIGRQGTLIDETRVSLAKKYGAIDLTIKEIKKPDINAVLVADSVARQIERRVAYRRAVKQVIQKAVQGGAKGIKVKVSGRLNGAEIARDETFKEGNTPLHTLRSIIDYAEERSETVYGTIGVKVWIYKGDSFKKKPQED